MIPDMILAAIRNSFPPEIKLQAIIDGAREAITDLERQRGESTLELLHPIQTYRLGKIHALQQIVELIEAQVLS